MCHLPSGKLLQFANLKMAIEIVDLPIQIGDFPQLCHSLPEGKSDWHDLRQQMVSSSLTSAPSFPWRASGPPGPGAQGPRAKGSD